MLLAWLLESFVVGTTSFSRVDGWADCWLAALVFTFSSVGGMIPFSLLAVMIALVSSPSRRPDLWVGFGIAVTIALLSSIVVCFPLVGCGWWAGRALRGRATRGWTATIGLVTALGWAPLFGGLRILDVVSPLAMVVAAIAGGLALRRHRIVRAQRLWAIGFGFGFIIFHNHFPHHWTAPMMLFLAVGPRTRWSPWVWGAASIDPVIALATGESGGIGLLLMLVAEAVVFMLLRHAVMARCARLAR